LESIDRPRSEPREFNQRLHGVTPIPRMAILSHPIAHLKSGPPPGESRPDREAQTIGPVGVKLEIISKY